MLLGIGLALAVAWPCINPPGRFGICFFALTTYGSIPRPIEDLQVRCDGATRSIEKTHSLKYEHVAWLLEPAPEVLIIATGWDGVAIPEARIEEISMCEVKVLKTGEAVRLYNRLKGQGRRVAIHVHSTC